MGVKQLPEFRGVIVLLKQTLLIELIVYKFNIIKDVRVEKFSQSYIKAVANIMERNNARILALVIEHTVNG